MRSSEHQLSTTRTRASLKARAVAVACCVVAVAAAVGGCGGGSRAASRSTGTAAGLAAEPALRILAAAEAAIDQVHSFHLQATAGIPGRPLRGHDGPVVMAVFSPDGKTLLSAGSRDKTVRLWDLTTYKVKSVMEGHEDEVRFVGFGAKGTFDSLSKEGVVKLWDADGKETASFLWEPEPGFQLPPYATSVALSPDGNTLAIGHDEVVDVWDLTKVKTK